MKFVLLNQISNSVIGKGLTAMVNDVSSFLMIWGTGACAAFAIYCLIRRGMADEHEGQVWQKRLIVSIVCAVGVFLVSALIKLISGYFSVGQV